MEMAWCERKFSLFDAKNPCFSLPTPVKTHWQMLRCFSSSSYLNLLCEWACAVSGGVTGWTPCHTHCRCTVWCLCVSSCGSEAGSGTGKSSGTQNTCRDNRYTHIFMEPNRERKCWSSSSTFWEMNLFAFLLGELNEKINTSCLWGNHEATARYIYKHTNMRMVSIFSSNSQREYE